VIKKKPVKCVGPSLRVEEYLRQVEMCRSDL
jgi:hypothetical protein